MTFRRIRCSSTLSARTAARASSAAARPQTAACARYSWTRNPSCPARCSRRARAVTVSPRSRAFRTKAGRIRRVYRGQGAEQCVLQPRASSWNALALFREKEYPTEEEIKEYLAGNLCRCTGYEGQLRGHSRVPRMEKTEGGGQGMKVVNKPLRKRNAMQLVTVSRCTWMT